MITLKPDEQQVRDYLIECARRGDPGSPQDACVTYGGLAQAVDPERRYPWSAWKRFNGIGPVLGHVSQYEAEHGRPLLSALAVRSDGRRPGDNFYPLARRLARELGREGPGEGADAEHRFWRAEITAAVRYWSDAPAAGRPGLQDAQYDAIMAELSSVKKMLRQLLHG
jgi:hypothetical protein